MGWLAIVDGGRVCMLNFEDELWWWWCGREEVEITHSSKKAIVNVYSTCMKVATSGPRRHMNQTRTCESVHPRSRAHSSKISTVSSRVSVVGWWGRQERHSKSAETPPQICRCACGCGCACRARFASRIARSACLGLENQLGMFRVE